MSGTCITLTNTQQPLCWRNTLAPTRNIPGLVRESILGRIPVSPAVPVFRSILRFPPHPHVAILERGQKVRTRPSEVD